MIRIYTLSDPTTKEVRYIGKTKKSLVERMYAHTSNYKLKTERSYKNSWIQSLKQKGLKPIIEEVDIVEEDSWEFWESYWISQFKSWGFNLTNMTLGGEGSNGGKGCLGYRHTEEAKKRISIANSKPKSKEWISNAAKGKFKPINQLSLDGNIIKVWESTTSAALALGNVNKKKNICNCLKGKKKSAYGFKWEIAELKDKEPLG